MLSHWSMESREYANSIITPSNWTTQRTPHAYPTHTLYSVITLYMQNSEKMYGNTNVKYAMSALCFVF